MASAVAASTQPFPFEEFSRGFFHLNSLVTEEIWAPGENVGFFPLLLEGAASPYFGRGEPEYVQAVQRGNDYVTVRNILSELGYGAIATQLATWLVKVRPGDYIVMRHSTSVKISGTSHKPKRGVYVIGRVERTPVPGSLDAQTIAERVDARYLEHPHYAEWSNAAGNTMYGPHAGSEEYAVKWFKLGLLDELATDCAEWTSYMSGQQTKTISDRLCAKAKTDERHQKILAAVWNNARITLLSDDADALRAQVLSLMNVAPASLRSPPAVTLHAFFKSPATVLQGSTAPPHALPLAPPVEPPDGPIDAPVDPALTASASAGKSPAQESVATRPKRSRDEALLLLDQHPKAFKFAVGATVRAKYQAHKGGREWFDGSVSACNVDGTYQISYIDGDFEERVSERHVQYRAEASGEAIIEPKVEIGAEAIDLTGESPQKRYVTAAARVQAQREHVKRELEDDNEDLHETQGYLITDAQGAKEKLSRLAALAKRALHAKDISDEFYAEFKQILD